MDTIRDRCWMSTDGEHYFTFDYSDSGKTVFCCSCGEQITEYEDAGTGA